MEAVYVGEWWWRLAKRASDKIDYDELGELGELSGKKVYGSGIKSTPFPTKRVQKIYQSCVKDD